MELLVFFLVLEYISKDVVSKVFRDKMSLLYKCNLTNVYKSLENRVLIIDGNNIKNKP